jgi:hypothetical protein
LRSVAQWLRIDRALRHRSDREFLQRYRVKIAQRLRNDCAAITQLRSGWKVIEIRFPIDCAAITQRLRSHWKLISKRFRIDCASIAHRLRFCSPFCPALHYATIAN